MSLTIYATVHLHILILYCSAGSRDSELTNHGVQQATRLGQHFAAADVQFTHIFSSQLKRAVKTAELVRVAQPVHKNGAGDVVAPITAQITELAEQDFGSYEGVSFLARQPGSKVSGKDSHRALHKDDPDFVDVESRDSMIRRLDVFLDNHLVPIIQAVATTPLCVAVVSHGITLSVLWRRLLNRMPPRSVSVHPEVLAKYSGIDLERIGGWGNTGYLELDITYSVLTTSVPVDPPLRPEAGPSSTTNGPALKGTEDPISATTPTRTSPLPPDVPLSTSKSSPMSPTKVGSNRFVGWTVLVCAVNSREHLVGLKRTGGGVGSSRHDDKQKSIDTFFKRRKVE